MRPDKAAGSPANIIISRFFLLFSRPFQQWLPVSDHQTSQGNRPKELTLRGLVLGLAITLVFTAANVYLGLKVGLTFASSIPADRKSTRLNSSHTVISYAVFCLNKKNCETQRD